MYMQTTDDSFIIESTKPLSGETYILGAKNSALVVMASLLLVDGVSRLSNIPFSADVMCMIQLLEELGARVILYPEEHMIDIDTRSVHTWKVRPEIMRQMRASIFVMGPLLARFKMAEVAFPGGDVIGARPIDLHLKWLAHMGAEVQHEHHFIRLKAQHGLQAKRVVLEYPSVGATENIIMAATLTPGVTTIINASLEPQVVDLINCLQKMGAIISISAPATVQIQGVSALAPVLYTIMPDWLEAGTVLIAAAATGGAVTVTNVRASDMDVFLLKLQEMGHAISISDDGSRIQFVATQNPQAVSFKTGPYPSFPTDLQAPMMALQCCAQGKSVIEETVFENRLLHVRELQKMGAVISVEGTSARIIGVDSLYGAHVVATDIRAATALVVAGMVAHGKTVMAGVHHWMRGYERLEERLISLGARIFIGTEERHISSQKIIQKQTTVR